MKPQNQPPSGHNNMLMITVGANLVVFMTRLVFAKHKEFGKDDFGAGDAVMYLSLAYYLISLLA
jgi:hypothetical protein